MSAAKNRNKCFRRRVQARMLRIYGNRCLMCGSTDKPITRDHIKPLAAGGTDQYKNFQPLCRECNMLKRDLHIRFYHITQSGDWYLPDGTVHLWTPTHTRALALGLHLDDLRNDEAHLIDLMRRVCPCPNTV